MNSCLRWCIFSAAAATIIYLVFCCCSLSTRRGRRTRQPPHDHPATQLMHTPLPHHRPVSLGKIHPNLFLGNVDAARHVARGTTPIQNLVCVASRATCQYPVAPGIEQYAFDTDIPDALRMSQREFESFTTPAAQWIREALQRGPTLVHCYAGINRSVASIVAYAMVYRGWSADDAIRYIRVQNETHRATPALLNTTFERYLRDRVFQ